MGLAAIPVVMLAQCAPQCAPPAPVPCDPDDRSGGEAFPLERCDVGWGVVWVLKALEAEGETFDPPPGATFTDEVEAAVRRFQRRHGLEVDGLVGPMTWFALLPEFRSPPAWLLPFDVDGSGRIEPDESGAIGDANSDEGP